MPTAAGTNVTARALRRLAGRLQDHAPAGYASGYAVAVRKLANRWEAGQDIPPRLKLLRAASLEALLTVSVPLFKVTASRHLRRLLHVGEAMSDIQEACLDFQRLIVHQGGSRFYWPDDRIEELGRVMRVLSRSGLIEAKSDARVYADSIGDILSLRRAGLTDAALMTTVRAELMELAGFPREGWFGHGTGALRGRYVADHEYQAGDIVCLGVNPYLARRSVGVGMGPDNTSGNWEKLNASRVRFMRFALVPPHAAARGYDAGDVVHHGDWAWLAERSTFGVPGVDPAWSRVMQLIDADA
jgi:hypothetical protein